MTKQQIFTSAGAAVLACGLIFSGPPSAYAAENVTSQEDQAGRYLRTGSERQANRPLMHALK